MPKLNPRVFGANLGFILFGIDVVDTLGLLRGVAGPFMGHCALKIHKTALYVTSELDL